MTDLVKRLRASFEGMPLCGKCAEAADEIERLRTALAPFAAFAEAHYKPGIGLGEHNDLGPDYVWLCPSPGYPEITTRCFVEAQAAVNGGSDSAPVESDDV